jgi:hypothetical protein
MARLGAIAVAGESRLVPPDPEEVAERVLTLLVDPAAQMRLTSRAQALIDGQGAHRISGLLHSLAVRDAGHPRGHLRGLAAGSGRSHGAVRNGAIPVRGRSWQP